MSEPGNGTRAADPSGASTDRDLLHRVLGARGHGTFALDLASGTMERSPAHDRLFGYDEAQPGWTLETLREHVLADDRAAFEGALERALETGELSFLGRFARPGRDEVRWLRLSGCTGRDQAGRAVRVVGLVEDVGDEKERDARERLLLAELQHRVRNTLAMIRAIARRTGEGREDFEDYLAHLSSRIGALARVQGMATRWPWAGVDLWELVSEELGAHLAREGEQVELAGPHLSLPLRMGELVGLAIHELTTNALKYGALSQPAGRIRVAWRVEGGAAGGGPPHLLLDWQERGVPLEADAARPAGFGREVLERALPHELGATTRLAFTGEGVHCSLDLPLDP